MKKITGIGNALVDILIRTEESVLDKNELPKGSMILVDSDRSLSIQKSLENEQKDMSSGGSVANTIRGIADLGGKAGYIGKVGNDQYGDFYENYMRDKGIETFVGRGNERTGCCTVLITEDSERTFATYLGAAIELGVDDITEDLFKGYSYFHIEGYLVQNKPMLDKAMEVAKAAGVTCSIDLASYNMVDENREYYLKKIAESIDIVFANEEEAASLTGKQNPAEALEIIAEMTEIAVVKCGGDGSLIAVGNERYTVAPFKVEAVDTTGAGDYYAAGFLYGLAAGYSYEESGMIGSRLASEVVRIIGTTLSEEKIDEINKWVKSELKK